MIPNCRECGYQLRHIVLVESIDEELWDASGMYCPMCVCQEVINRAGDFEALHRSYQQARLFMGESLGQEELLSASA